MFQLDRVGFLVREEHHAMTTLSKTVLLTFTVVDCFKCGTPFGITEQFERDRRHDHGSFYCPNGHSQAYLGKSEAEKLRDRLAASEARAKSWMDQADAAERSLRAQKGEATKLRKRLAAGVCPCCKRSFQNLHRHMAGQHPDYADTP